MDRFFFNRFSITIIERFRIRKQMINSNVHFVKQKQIRRISYLQTRYYCLRYISEGHDEKQR